VQLAILRQQGPND
jgi:hypothetical protein